MGASTARCPHVILVYATDREYYSRLRLYLVSSSHFPVTPWLIRGGPS